MLVVLWAIRTTLPRKHLGSVPCGAGSLVRRVRAETESMFSPVTVVAENLKPLWESVFTEPAVKPVSATFVTPKEFGAMPGSLSIYMVESEKDFVRLSTANTPVSTIGSKDILLEFPARA